MAECVFRFGSFCLDPQDRKLLCGGEPVGLNARYLDALILLVRERGALVTKERLHQEVWHGVPVTDEALTQCVRNLRKQLGDDAANPRFIETVPKHGYRFVAPVEMMSGQGQHPAAAAHLGPGPNGAGWRQVSRLGAAGTAGGAAAGILGGLLYGFAVATQNAAAGSVSIVAVLVLVTGAVAMIGAAGVAFGVAAAAFSGEWAGYWMIPGGAAGGLLVGAVVKLVGLDAFTLLVGQSPGDITGAGEGALLGAAVGLGARLSMRRCGRARTAWRLAPAALTGATAGILIALLDGRMMGGSLALLGERFPASRLRLDTVAALFGESGFGPLSRAATGALEGALYAACIVGAMMFAMRAPAQAPGEARAIHTP